ncbi:MULTISPECIES: hypothetical protein [Allobacillus]|uniref:Uncharacterized protein n=1 Tax=Allobacillus salarius TaxID=1955272 RepID=A0A556PM60_9BACI|nr:hypothetical protein [Allobacillus salarius]TSJ65484.1 hypothetical protein FPQ13_06670 [Allobacillus salarius]
MNDKVVKIVKDTLWMDNKNLNNITLNNLENKMNEVGFDDDFIKEIIQVFKQKIVEQGEREFQQELVNLHFKCPGEFQSEEKAVQTYDKYHSWLESEVKNLENETKLSWEKQTEDIEELNEKARKTQLVIRHRLSEIVLELI